MMNILALFLVASSLMAAAVWPPSQEMHQTNHDEDVIVKEGHRVVTVEYDEEGRQHKTKVSISPHQPHQAILEEANETLKDPASVLPDLGQGISSEEERPRGTMNRPSELICDAPGKCKHKMASVIGKGKERAHEAMEKAAETVHKVAREAKDAVVDSAERVTETVPQRAKDVEEGAKEKAQDAREKAAEIVDDVVSMESEMAHKAKDTAERMKETVSQKAKDVKEGAKESLDRAKKKAQEAAEKAAEMKNEMAHEAKDSVVGSAERVKETVAQKAEDVEESANQYLHKASEGMVVAGAGNVFCLMRRMGSGEAWESLMKILSLMGFSAAYGMGLWVTFISSHVLARALPRQQFAVVQSKIYPVYFRAMAYSIGAALLGHILVRRKRLFTNKAEMFQGYNLLAALVMVLVNAKYLEPKATKVMFERLKVEKEESRGGESPKPAAEAAASEPLAPSQQLVRSKIAALSEKLRKLNTYSSFLNVVSLMALSCHQVYLGYRLSTTS